MRLIILRKSSIKRTLALAVILIMLVLNISNPFKASASSNLYYLYPAPSSNPLNTSLFWSEADPAYGSYSLGMWSQIMPDKKIVVGLPEGYQVNAAMLGNNIGKYITAKIGGKLKAGSKATGSSSPKDSITYERKITSDSIEEKVRVEVGEHFKDNDSFEKYLDTIKQNLTNKDELPDRAPESAPVEVPPEAAKAVGNSLVLGGVALMLIKMLPLLAL